METRHIFIAGSFPRLCTLSIVQLQKELTDAGFTVINPYIVVGAPDQDVKFSSTLERAQYWAANADIVVYVGRGNYSNQEAPFWAGLAYASQTPLIAYDCFDRDFEGYIIEKSIASVSTPDELKETMLQIQKGKLLIT